MRTTSFWRGRLPHWEVEHATYFITLRVHGTLPAGAERELKALSDEIKRCPESKKRAMEQLVLLRTEEWLDNASERLYLKSPEVAKMVVDAIDNLVQRQIWSVVAYVVMPNHLHLLVTLLRSSLEETMIPFKRWTAGKAIALLGLRHRPFWQEEWFDHWIRSDEKLDEKIDYILANPVKARLVKDPTDWPYGSWNLGK